ncbi:MULTISPECIES: PRC-barrel domain-containing protein [Aneurinibacillus]|uniref:PRC-barrel domain-containing protein n=1 Tax=Aneurinibacillus thermoaerophilus TaxID=143495 RepID=A0A1G7ZSC6_ANETH|nr:MULTISPECIES: PRC-barrel domain-containing protein [Aneurinibacillus]AMA72111.1 hypothetical protein ACH33_04100 [Aneurinibacillus sp. XH2]MED0678906.1 PRC-barrel domain-containing protein [Aneurinibacillus thermoaerophilus]MED0736443.1 PRC-barrel domain-containing protein [Aneurinibacillus thermoaerophilus]MED0763106.1 PRC-barrel domain-containing protein [Aneurinibacillus thermoaerophilus]QYY42121.1 PRC-barrel domain-containing protein [Aneurinibacillus thermoaerophilus]
MKRSQELIGMPIISIMDGKEIGKVKNLLVNPASGVVDFLTVHNERWTLGIKVLPFAHVGGLGDYAVMTENESSVIDLSEDTLANELKAKGIQIIDSKVITTAGQLLGTVTEYYVNKENGKIEGYVVEKEGNEPGVLASAFIITIGKEILVVKEESNANLLDEQQFAGEEQPLISEEHPFGREEKTLISDEQSFVKEEQQVAGDTVTQEEGTIKKEIPFEKEWMAKEQPLPLFKNLPNLTGKRLTTDLYDEQGKLLLAKGDVITAEVMEQVKQLGRNKLFELTLKLAE